MDNQIVEFVIGCRLVPTTVIAVSKTLPDTVRTPVSSNEDKLYDVVHLSPCIYMVLISDLYFLGVKTYHRQRKTSAARRTSSPKKWEESSWAGESF